MASKSTAVAPLVSWSDVDAHPHAMVQASAGIMAAVALAVLGLPPLNLHGPLHFAGLMDPLCGMTRGVRLVVRGNLAEAIRFNPASPVVVLLGAAAVLRGVYGRRVGRWVTVTWRSPERLSVAAVLIVALEINQQLHADRLMG